MPTTWAILFATLAVGGDEPVRVMTAGAVAAAHLTLSPEFERATGLRVATLATSTGLGDQAIAARVRRGEAVDVLILARAALDELIKDGLVSPSSCVDLARSSIGAAVRRGAPKPDISSVAALRQTLLRATSVAYSAQVSGAYLTTDLFPRLGIAEAMAAKGQRVERERVGAVVARGEAEIGFQQISELLDVPGIDYVGPLPAEVQRVTVFSAGVAQKTTNALAAQRFIEFLAGDRGVRVMRASGLDPLLPSRRVPCSAGPGATAR